MAKSVSLILLVLVGLSRCQLPGQESRILNNGGGPTRNQPPVLVRGGPTSGDLRNLQVWYYYYPHYRHTIIFFCSGVWRHSSRNNSLHTDRPGTTATMLIYSENIAPLDIFENSTPKNDFTFLPHIWSLFCSQESSPSSWKWPTKFRIQRVLDCSTRSVGIISASTLILGKSPLSRWPSLTSLYFSVMLKSSILWLNILFDWTEPRMSSDYEHLLNSLLQALDRETVDRIDVVITIQVLNAIRSLCIPPCFNFFFVSLKCLLNTANVFTVTLHCHITTLQILGVVWQKIVKDKRLGWQC